MKKTPDFDDYKQCLFLGENAFGNQLLFQSKLNEVHTVEVNKLALSRNNDKQVVQSDGVSALAHGHKNTPNDIALSLGAVPHAKPVCAKPAPVDLIYPMMKTKLVMGMKLMCLI